MIESSESYTRMEGWGGGEGGVEWVKQCKGFMFGFGGVGGLEWVLQCDVGGWSVSDELYYDCYWYYASRPQMTRVCAGEAVRWM